MLLFIISPEDEKIKERNDEIEKLYIKHSKELMNFALSRRFSEKESEDIVQEAFITLIKKYNTTEIKNPRAWLYKTVEFIILNNAKTEKQHLSTEQDVKIASDGGIEIYIATSSVLETIKKALTDKEFELFSDYFFIQGNGKNDFKTSTERSRISRIKDKVRKALKENECTPDSFIYENSVSQFCIAKKWTSAVFRDETYTDESNVSAVYEGNNFTDESGVSIACEGNNCTNENNASAVCEGKCFTNGNVVSTVCEGECSADGTGASESSSNEGSSDNSSSKEGATV